MKTLVNYLIPKVKIKNTLHLISGAYFEPNLLKFCLLKTYLIMIHRIKINLHVRPTRDLLEDTSKFTLCCDDSVDIDINRKRKIKNIRLILKLNFGFFLILYLTI